jgi:hypothetical protein
VEAAIAIASVMVVVVLCIGAVVATSMHIRCVDAAREAARLAARGDATNAQSSAQRVAPGGARVGIRTDGDHVVATVSVEMALLPLIEISAEAVAAMEPEPE